MIKQHAIDHAARGLRQGISHSTLAAHTPDVQQSGKANHENRGPAAIVPRLLSMRQVTTMTTYSRPSIYRLIAQGRFPKPIKLGDVKIAFRADDVEAWLASRPTALGGDDTNI